jgi:hypothetical protein
MQNKRGNQAEGITLPATNTGVDPTKSDPELDKLGAQLQANIPNDIVSLPFRDALRSKIIEVQANEKTKG